MEERGLIVLAILTSAMLSTPSCVCSGIDFGTARVSRVGVVRGSGNMVEEERQVSGFTGVALGGIGDLTIEVGEEETLRIEAEDNLLGYIETEVRDGTLRVQTRDKVNLKPKRSIHFYLTVKELNTIVLSGLGDIEVPGLETGRFAVRISGMGDVKVGELNADRLDGIISGMGDLEIAGGQVEAQDIIISGAGEYRAGDVRSDKVEITTSGVGNATVWATETLDVLIGGSGSVNYYGTPRIDFSRSGSGTLNSLGDR
jgi:hypothetical protein